MTANARPLHSFNGVWDVYQVSFICFRLISSFSPLFSSSFLFLLSSFRICVFNCVITKLHSEASYISK